MRNIRPATKGKEIGSSLDSKALRAGLLCFLEKLKAMKKVDLNHRHLCSTLVYDKETGAFFRKSDFDAGILKRLGSAAERGYRKISVFGMYFREHRLVWFYVYGEWPKNDVDHINGDRADNRVCNLRDITRKQNLENRNKFSGKSGSRNVCWATKQGAWKAVVTHNYVQHRLGFFKEKSDAEAAAKAARDRLFTHHTA